MKIRQLSVFLENRVGRLDVLIKLLGDNNINIKAISVADTESFGIIRLIVDRLEEAAALLLREHFVCKLNNVTVLAVRDEPGGLAEVLTLIHQTGVNIEYMYAIAAPRDGRPLMVFRFGDGGEAAVNALSAAGIDILDEERLL